MLALLRSRKVRNTLLQVLFVGTIVLIVVIGWFNAKQTLERQRVTSGFDFLWRSTGWEGNFSLLSATPNDPYWWFFVVGLANTLFLGTVGLVLATVVGMVIGLARTSSNELLRLMGRLYVDFFRNIPLILQVFFWYAFVTHMPAPRAAYDVMGLKLSSRGIYVPALNVDGAYLFVSAVCLVAAIVVPFWLGRTRHIAHPPEERRGLRLAAFAGLLALAAVACVAGRVPGETVLSMPQLQGLNIRGGVRVSPEFSALTIAMMLYGGAYVGEIVRGGFKAVDRGQAEAAQSLGLTPWQVFSRVRLPLALRAMLPILANQYIWLIKATTLGITIGFSDFFMVVAITINQAGQTLEAIGIFMAGFLLINLSLAALFNRINKAIALKGNQLRS